MFWLFSYIHGDQTARSICVLATAQLRILLHHLVELLLVRAEPQRAPLSQPRLDSYAVIKVQGLLSEVSQTFHHCGLELRVSLHLIKCLSHF